MSFYGSHFEVVEDEKFFQNSNSDEDLGSD